MIASRPVRQTSKKHVYLELAEMVRDFLGCVNVRVQVEHDLPVSMRNVKQGLLFTVS